jgi:hypothetical protein
MEDDLMAIPKDDCTDNEGPECCVQWPNFCCGCPLPTERERLQTPKLENIARGAKQLKETADGVSKALDLLLKNTEPMK